MSYDSTDHSQYIISSSQDTQWPVCFLNLRTRLLHMSLNKVSEHCHFLLSRVYQEERRAPQPPLSGCCIIRTHLTNTFFLLYFATGENGGTALLGVSWQQCPFREREMAGLEQYCHLGGGAVWTKHVRRSWGGGGCSARRPFEIKKTSESADEQKESQRHSFQLSEGGLLCPCFHRMSRCTGQSMGVVGQDGGLSLFRTL